MTFTLTIDTDNAAFAENPTELAELVAFVAARLLQTNDDFAVRDTNGNTVGTATFTD